MTLIMVVDDDQDLAEMLAIVLTGDGMEVDLVSRGDQVIDVFRNSQPDLVLLDLMLPGLDGIEVCRLIRAESMIPIVMLTAKGDTTDVVKGLEAGADDYVVKPFSADELIARVRALLRRSRPSGVIQAPVVAIEIASATVDLIGREMSGPRGMVRLTDREARLILALARAQGLLSRQAIYREAYFREWDPNDRSIDVHVTNLRKKFETICGVKNVISSIRGRGYQLRFGSKLISSED